MPDQHETAVQVALLSQSVQALERKSDEHADLVRESLTSLRDDLRSDMREIRDGMAADVKEIARNVADLHNRIQNPESGIIKIVNDHENRLKVLERVLESARNGLRRVLWFLLFGVLAFIGAALIRYAPSIGHWIADVKSPTNPGGH